MVSFSRRYRPGVSRDGSREYVADRAALVRMLSRRTAHETLEWVTVTPECRISRIIVDLARFGANGMIDSSMAQQTAREFGCRPERAAAGTELTELFFFFFFYCRWGKSRPSTTPRSMPTTVQITSMLQR